MSAALPVPSATPMSLAVPVSAAPVAAAPAPSVAQQVQADAAKRVGFLAVHMPVKVLERYFSKEPSKCYIEPRSLAHLAIHGGYSQHSFVSDAPSDGKRVITFRVLHAAETHASLTIVHYKSYKQCAQVFRATFSFIYGRYDCCITNPRPGLRPYTKDEANDYAIYCIDEAMTCKGLGTDEYAYQDVEDDTPHPAAAALFAKALNRVDTDNKSVK